MNASTVRQAERTRRNAWASVKPVTQHEIIEAIRAAILEVPIRRGDTEPDWRYRQRIAFLSGYLGNGRPKLGAALRDLIDMPHEYPEPAQ